MGVVKNLHTLCGKSRGKVVRNSWELTCINSPSLTLFLKEAKTVHSDNSYCWTLEPSWSIACGISITALTTGGENEREKMAREWWWFGRTKSSTQIYSLPLALHYNAWGASGIRGQEVIGTEGLWNEDKESKICNNVFLKQTNVWSNKKTTATNWLIETNAIWSTSKDIYNICKPAFLWTLTKTDREL